MSSCQVQQGSVCEGVACVSEAANAGKKREPWRIKNAPDFHIIEDYENLFVLIL